MREIPLQTTDSHWTPYLQALRLARNQQSYALAQKVRWLLPVVPAFFAAWIYFNLNIAVISCVVLSLVILRYTTGGWGSVSSAQKRAQQASPTAVEKLLLQDLAAQVHPNLKLEFQCPPLLQPLKDSGLVALPLEYAHASRSLSGVTSHHQAFLATYIEAGYMQEYRDSQKRLQRHPKTTFQGLFLLLEFAPIQKGWVKIKTDKLEALGWLADEWRASSGRNHYVRMENPDFERHFHLQASERQLAFEALSAKTLVHLSELWTHISECELVIHIKNGVLAAAIPMSSSPLEIRHNESLWRDDLRDFEAAAKLVSQLVEAFEHNSNAARRPA